MKHQLTQDEVRRLFDYHEDGYLIRRVYTSWRAQIGDVAGHCGAQGYRRISINHRNFLAHRLIFLWHHGWLPIEVDHLDLDRTNCRIEYLRAATPAQNMWNTSSPLGKSGVKGVYWFPRTRKWVARCKVRGKCHSLGYYSDIKDAEAVVRKFREEHHGEFANHGDGCV